MNERQEAYLVEQSQKRMRKKAQAQKEALSYKFLVENPCYQEVKAQLMEITHQPQSFELTQEGALKALCHNKYIEGLTEFFAIVERKAKEANKSY